MKLGCFVENGTWTFGCSELLRVDVTSDIMCPAGIA